MQKVQEILQWIEFEDFINYGRAFRYIFWKKNNIYFHHISYEFQRNCEQGFFKSSFFRLITAK